MALDHLLIALVYHEVGCSISRTARELGLKSQSVEYSLIRQGLHKRRYKAPRFRGTIETVRPMYEGQGMSCTEIAKALGTSAETIRTMLVQHGVPRRPVGSSPMEKNPAWRGGKRLDKTGYVLVRKPDHPQAVNGYVREHRLVAEEMLGRYLDPDEVVHHIDGDKQNNAPENLEVFQSNGEHLKHELAGRTPSWSEDGKRRISRAVRNYRRKLRESGFQHPGRRGGATPKLSEIDADPSR